MRRGNCSLLQMAPTYAGGNIAQMLPSSSDKKEYTANCFNNLITSLVTRSYLHAHRHEFMYTITHTSNYFNDFYTMGFGMNDNQKKIRVFNPENYIQKLRRIKKK